MSSTLAGNFTLLGSVANLIVAEHARSEGMPISFWAYFKVGDLPKALENLERAVELEPAVAEINDHLGDVYAAVNRTLEARYQWERVLTLEADEEMKARARAKIDATPDPAPIVAASIEPANASQ